jgi:hypothetical protein
MFRTVAVASLSAFVALSSAGPIRIRAEQLAKPGNAKFDYVGMVLWVSSSIIY